MHSDYDGYDLNQYDLREYPPKERLDLGYPFGKIGPEYEKDPNGIDLKTPGAKADDGKPPLLQGVLQYFPRALRVISLVSLAGAKKYSWKGWESVDDGINRYGDALVRHLIAEQLEGPLDKDTGQLHAAQVAWNSCARLELILKEKENDKTIQS